MNTKQLIFNMLTENTGRHMLDSGGAYGRNWERNQAKTIEDFENEPEQRIEFDGKYLYRTVSVFHYLSQLELDWICDLFNELPCPNWDADGEVYGVSDTQWEWLNNKFEVKVIRTFNTYNGDSDLSQILQGSWVELNEEQYLLLQIHGGCDARGGYTDAKLFKPAEEWSIHPYLFEYMDQYELGEEIANGVEVYDYSTGELLNTDEVLKALGSETPR